MADIALLYAEQYKKLKGAKQDNTALVPAVDGESLLVGIARRAGQAINHGMEKFPIMGADGAVDLKGLFAFAIVEGIAKAGKSGRTQVRAWDKDGSINWMGRTFITKS